MRKQPARAALSVDQVGARGGEAAREALSLDPEQCYRFADAAQCISTERTNGKGLIAAEGRDNSPGRDDLAALGGGHDPCPTMDVQPNLARPRHLRPSPVQ